VSRADKQMGDTKICGRTWVNEHVQSSVKSVTGRFDGDPCVEET
jgi:hypothetical protein